jgi:hypothetical protein
MVKSPVGTEPLSTYMHTVIIKDACHHLPVRLPTPNEVVTVRVTHFNQAGMDETHFRDVFRVSYTNRLLSAILL